MGFAQLIRLLMFCLVLFFAQSCQKNRASDLFSYDAFAIKSIAVNAQINLILNGKTLSASDIALEKYSYTLTTSIVDPASNGLTPVKISRRGGTPADSIPVTSSEIGKTIEVVVSLPANFESNLGTLIFEVQVGQSEQLALASDDITSSLKALTVAKPRVPASSNGIVNITLSSTVALSMLQDDSGQLVSNDISFENYETLVTKIDTIQTSVQDDIDSGVKQEPGSLIVAMKKAMVSTIVADTTIQSAIKEIVALAAPTSTVTFDSHIASIHSSLSKLDTTTPTSVFKSNSATVQTISSAITKAKTGPTVQLAAASKSYVSPTSETSIAITFTDSVAKGTKLTDKLTAAGGGLGVTYGSGVSCSTVAISPLTEVTGNTITFSGCSGEGTVEVQVNAGAAIDADGNYSSLSNSVSFTVQGTPPSASSLTPVTAFLSAIPTSIVVSFNQVMTALTSAQFTLSGTCTSLPTKGETVLMSSDSKSATLALSGGACADGQTLSVSVAPSAVLNAAGTAGTGSTLTSTYTMNTVAPTATLASPSAAYISSSASTSINISFASSSGSTLALKGSLTSAGSGLTITYASGVSCSTVGVSPLSSVTGNAISFSGCSGTGLVSVQVNAGVVSDSVGNLSSASNTVSFTVQGSAPTLTSLTPATSFLTAAPTSVVANFSQAMTALTANDFTISGTCTTLPSKGAVTMSNSASTATLALSGASCADGQTVIVSVTPANVSNGAGTAGTGATVTNTYTIDSVGPTVTLASPSSSNINSSATTTINISFADAGVGNISLSGSLTSSGSGLTISYASGVSCSNVSVAPLSSATGNSVSLSGCTGDGSVSVQVNSGVAADSLGNSSSASNTVSFSVLNTVPTISSSTPANASNVAAVPSSIAVVFSKVVSQSNAFAISGTCSTLPTIASVSGSGSSATLTVNLSGGSCALNETLILTVTLSSISDLANNSGSGSSTITLTKITPVKKVFVTSSTYDGNLGGTAGADAKCASDSNNPNDGTYKAVLLVYGAGSGGAGTGARVACPNGNGNCVTTSSNNIDWVITANGDIKRLDGTLIGQSNGGGIFTGTLTNAVGASSVHVWTGLNSDWSPYSSGGATCNSWTSSSGTGCAGDSGTTSIGNAFGCDFSDSCSTLNHLYCVEQ